MPDMICGEFPSRGPSVTCLSATCLRGTLLDAVPPRTSTANDSPDLKDMDNLIDSMGNDTDTMTRFLTSFLRIGVAMIVLVGLSAGAAMGQVTIDPSQPGVNQDGNPASDDGSNAAYFAGELQDAIQTASANGQPLIVLNSGEVNNQNGVSQYNLPTNFTIEGDGEVTLTLDRDLNLGGNQLNLDGVSSGDGVNVRFPGNNISLLADGSAGTNVSSATSSDTFNRIVFSGEGSIEELNQTGVEEVVIERLSINGGPVLFDDNDDPGESADELTVNEFLAVDDELDLGGSVLNYGQTSVDISTDGNNLSASATVSNGQRFNINLGASGTTSYSIEGNGDLAVPVTYQNGGATLDTVRFQQSGIGQFGFSNFGTAGPVNRVEFPNLTDVRANLQIQGSNTDVDFGADVSVGGTARILSDATVEANSFTANGDVEIDNSAVTFGDVSTFDQQFDAANGAVVDFNNAATFEGATTVVGSGTQLDFNAPGAIGASEVNGDLDFTSGTITLVDDTGGGNGLHNLEINGDAKLGTGGSVADFNEGDDGDGDATRIFFAGSSPQDIQIAGTGTIEIERLTTENSAELTGGGVLDLGENLFLRAGTFTTNASLNAVGIDLVRVKNSDGNGELRAGNAPIAYTGNLGQDPSDVDVPTRIEYQGDENISTGDELIRPAEDSLDRQISEFAVDMDTDQGQPVVTLNPDYTVESSLEILGGNLSLGSASIRLKDGATFVRGDGTLDPGPVPPEDALLFPNVTDANAGSDGIDLEYVNTIDLDVGIELPDTTRDKNVVRNVFVHSSQENEGNVSLRDQSGGQSVYRVNGDFVHADGTFGFNGQKLESNADAGAEAFAVADSAEVATPDGSTLRLVGPEAHVVAGVDVSSGDNDYTYNLPTTVVEKDTTGGNEPTALFAVINNGSSETQGFEIDGDFEVSSVGNDVSSSDGLFVLQTNEFTVTNDFTQQDGFGLVAAEDSFNVGNNLTKATDDTTSTLLSLAGNRIDVGGNVDHSGATDTDFINNNIGGGLILWTVGSSDESTVSIGGNVTQEDGYATIATTVASGTNFTEQVTVGGDVTVNGGQFLFDNPFSTGPVASERVDIGGAFDVEGGQVSGNLFPQSTLDRRETLAASSLTIGTGAAGATSAKDVAEQAEGIVGTLYSSHDDRPELGDTNETLGLGLDNGFSVSEDLSTDIGEEEGPPEIGGEDVSASDLTTDLSVPSDIDFNDKSSLSAKSAHTGSYDKFDIANSTTIEENGRFLLGGHSLEQGGDFTLSGLADDTTSADSSGVRGLVYFDGDSQQTVETGDSPNQYLHGVAVDGEEGISLEGNLTLNTGTTDTTNTANDDQFNRAFGTLFLESGDVVTGSDTLKVLQPTPTDQGDLAQALNADGVAADASEAPQSPVIGGTRNSHIVGTLQRALEQTGSTGGFVTDGYIYPLGDGEVYSGLILQLPTDLGDTQSFTATTVESPGIALPSDLTSQGYNEADDQIFDVDLNVQSGPYFEVSVDEQPDENLNIRAIAGELSGATITDIKQMRLVQFDTGAGTVQEAGRYDFSGDPNDDVPDGPNSFISGVPNVIHEGVDLTQGSVIGLASQQSVNPIGDGEAVGAEIAGTVTYPTVSGDSLAEGRALEGVTVEVSSSDTTATATTDANGNYTILGLPAGDYDVEATVSDTVENVGIGDAQRTVANFVSSFAAPFQEEVADVNGSGTANATDALLIARFATDRIDQFDVGSFVTESETVTLGEGGSAEATLFAAEAGDVRLQGGETGSSQSSLASSTISPKTGTAATQSSAASSSVAQAGKTFEVPVQIDRRATVGAYQMTFDFPSEKASFEGIKGARNVITNASDGTVTVGWFDRDGKSALDLRDGSDLVTLQFKAAKDVEEVTFAPEVTSGEITGADAMPITAGVEVQAIKIGAPTPEEFALNGSYPNPVQSQATIDMDLPSRTDVTVEVYNVLGQRVQTMRRTMSAGAGQTLQLDGSDFASGQYFYRVKADFEDETVRKSGRITVVK
jgi:hypothetical protein